MFKKYEEFIERLDKKLEKKFGSEDRSPLNPFIYDYYTNLKGNEIDEALENVKDNIFSNNKSIDQFKEILSLKDYTDKVVEVITEEIDNLEYANDTNVEIIKVLERQQFLEKEKKNKKLFSFKNLFHSKERS